MFLRVKRNGCYNGTQFSHGQINYDTLISNKSTRKFNLQPALKSITIGQMAFNWKPAQSQTDIQGISLDLL